LNPDEQVWNEVKNNNVGKTQIFSFSDLKGAVRRGLRKLQMMPDSVRAFFRHKDCKYAAA
ncbi:MAG: IS630 family transposase, partial [Alphaproteobacteria bacterium]|nr:IS630 family transposase [Alphaproteobacteria bacterium]